MVEDSVTTGAIPVPVSVTVSGLLAALSVIVSVAFRVPATAGLNAILIVQLAATARLPPEVGQFVPAANRKSPGLAPVTVMLVTVNGASPLLASVTVWAALVLPTA